MDYRGVKYSNEIIIDMMLEKPWYLVGRSLKIIHATITSGAKLRPIGACAGSA